MEQRKQKMFKSIKKIDEIMLIIALIILVILVIFSLYFFIFQNIKQGQEKEYINEQTKALNIDKDNVIESPNEQDIRDLIDKIKNQKGNLNEEDKE